MLLTFSYVYSIRSYYSTDGIEYGIGRVPIGGSDFSTYAYTYLDDSPGDVTLSNFSLKMEDTVYKVYKEPHQMCNIEHVFS